MTSSVLPDILIMQSLLALRATLNDAKAHRRAGFQRETRNPKLENFQRQLEIVAQRQREFTIGWAKAAALPAEKSDFTTTVGKVEPLPTLHRRAIQLHFSLQYQSQVRISSS
jgi:hypothetical protein